MLLLMFVHGVAVAVVIEFCLLPLLLTLFVVVRGCWHY